MWQQALSQINRPQLGLHQFKRSRTTWQQILMNQQIQEIIKQVGTDVSGKWISVDRAEKFAQLVIEQYNKELKESRREIKSQLGYSRVGLRNI